MVALGAFSISTILNDLNKQVKIQKDWDKHARQYLTVESISPSQKLWQDLQANQLASNDYFSHVFHEI
ncbi:hypothetical protein ACVRWE_04150 [Streptococcus urinalis]|uniref:Uncharacterized protein n=1 Tax=Streptococcus urinalis 2285-97 TaxID=764291 RepID=G5KDR4_9STRE|nr:hypothetical protein [Streptococcus urinalis]EHJ57093.1 hypothetical protein STRUR_1932 [Streptococcus urinalis 2285-97]